MTTSDEAEREELLLMRLLAGFDDDQPKEPLFLQPDSPEEKRARTVLAKQLREGRLGGFAKEFLALAIDPWTASTAVNMGPRYADSAFHPRSVAKTRWSRGCGIEGGRGTIQSRKKSDACCLAALEEIGRAVRSITGFGRTAF
jgi:hypothetical protein